MSGRLDNFVDLGLESKRFSPLFMAEFYPVIDSDLRVAEVVVVGVGVDGLGWGAKLPDEEVLQLTVDIFTVSSGGD